MKFSVAALSLMSLVGLAGCSAGGPDGPAPNLPPPGPVPSPVQQVLPASYDFGKVTTDNVPAPLEVTVRNAGNAPLQLSTIALGTAADSGFSLRLGGGSKPCGSGAATFPAGDLCTLEVEFRPPPANTGMLTASLQIASNDRTSPVSVPLSGSSEPVAAYTVRINQLQSACTTNPNEVTAYVSVTDQGGYPVTGLLSPSYFSVTQEGGLATNRPGRFVRRTSLQADRDGRRTGLQQQPDQSIGRVRRHEERLHELLRRHENGRHR